MVKILKMIIPSFVDYPDNESLCLCVVFMGCTHNCKGCQNIFYQNPQYDNGFTVSVNEEKLIKMIEKEAKKNHTNKIVFSGGDPLSKYNINLVKNVLSTIGERFDICVYTGYDIDYVKENDIKGFKFIKCGEFDIDNRRESFKNDNEMVLATSNQAFYDGNYNQLSNNGILSFD